MALTSARRIEFGRHGGAAAAVDAEQDGADIGVFGGLAEGLGHIVRSHGGPAHQRIDAVRPALDRAGAVDHRDGRPGPVGASGGVQVIAGFQQFGPGAAAFLRRLGHLVEIAQLVDQLGVHRFPVQERSLVDQLAERRRLHAAALRNARDELFLKVADESFHHLPMRLGEAAFGEGVHEALVFLAVAKLRRHPDLIQRAAPEGDGGAQPRQADKADRLKPDAVERAGDVVGPVARPKLAEAFGKGEGEAAAGAEPLDRGAEFLRLAGPDLVAAQPGHHTLDAGVHPATVQRIHHVAQVVAPAEQGIRQPAVRAVSPPAAGPGSGPARSSRAGALRAPRSSTRSIRRRPPAARRSSRPARKGARRSGTWCLPKNPTRTMLDLPAICPSGGTRGWGSYQPPKPPGWTCCRSRPHRRCRRCRRRRSLGRAGPAGLPHRSGAG